MQCYGSARNQKTIDGNSPTHHQLPFLAGRRAPSPRTPLPHLPQFRNADIIPTTGLESDIPGAQFEEMERELVLGGAKLCPGLRESVVGGEKGDYEYLGAAQLTTRATSVISDVVLGCRNERLFAAQCHHRIDPHGAPSGDITS